MLAGVEAGAAAAKLIVPALGPAIARLGLLAELDTGIHPPAAIAPDRRHGYQSIPCFGRAVADPSGAVPPTRIG